MKRFALIALLIVAGCGGQDDQASLDRGLLGNTFDRSPCLAVAGEPDER